MTGSTSPTPEKNGGNERPPKLPRWFKKLALFLLQALLVGVIGGTWKWFLSASIPDAVVQQFWLHMIIVLWHFWQLLSTLLPSGLACHLHTFLCLLIDGITHQFL